MHLTDYGDQAFDENGQGSNLKPKSKKEGELESLIKLFLNSWNYPEIVIDFNFDQSVFAGVDFASAGVDLTSFFDQSQTNTAPASPRATNPQSTASSGKNRYVDSATGDGPASPAKSNPRPSSGLGGRIDQKTDSGDTRSTSRQRYSSSRGSRPPIIPPRISSRNAEGYNDRGAG